ncbi:MAG: DUF5683 domain-containing protein [Flavobacteriales bacterium]
MSRALVLLICLIPLNLYARVDTSKGGDSTQHSPRTATIRSAILPGLGQAYNDKYWKIPIIYGGLGASGYFIVRNSKRFRTFRSALIKRHDPNKTDPYRGIYNVEQLRTLKETYRRWRDLSYISLVAVYVLQVLDANVDAHLYDFDVSDDLSLRLEPWTGSLSRPLGPYTTGNGFSLSLRF